MQSNEVSYIVAGNLKLVTIIFGQGNYMNEMRVLCHPNYNCGQLRNLITKGEIDTNSTLVHKSAKVKLLNKEIVFHHCKTGSILSDNDLVPEKVCVLNQAEELDDDLIKIISYHHEDSTAVIKNHKMMRACDVIEAYGCSVSSVVFRFRGDLKRRFVGRQFVNAKKGDLLVVIHR